MHLTRLNIHRVRNLQEVVLTPHPQFNILVGENGSGKTSLLEAIHLLAIGRSFRSRQSHSVISYHQDTLACFGEILDSNGNRTPLGIEKNRQGGVVCKVAGELCARLSFFATLLPIQLMTPETFKLLTAGAEERRKFIDWGVFHVEHSFASLCQRYQRLLKQRNAALKQRSSGPSLLAWERDLVEIGEKISTYRVKYLDELLVCAQQMQARLLPDLPITFQYQQGWDRSLSFEEALAGALFQDQKWGYTSVGPHRAEIVMQVQKFPAHQVLSRGQQKLLICVLYLAQAQHLYALTGKKCVYLIDDLASELDKCNRQAVLQVLAEQNHQIFITGVDDLAWEGEFAGEMFHVEHGRIQSAIIAC
jgi:DNA replication and repair protein RecF